MEKKQKVVLQALVINHTVQPKLKELFEGEDLYYYIVWDKLITDYTNDEQIVDFYTDGGSKIIDIVRKHKDADYYIISSGGVFQSMILDRLLRTQGVTAKPIVYQSTIGKYCVIPFEIYGGSG